MIQAQRTESAKANHWRRDVLRKRRILFPECRKNDPTLCRRPPIPTTDSLRAVEFVRAWNRDLRERLAGREAQEFAAAAS